MFDTKESVPEPTTPVANVGKLSEARLRLNANSDTPDPDKEASVDTHIVPSGKVSSVFYCEFSFMIVNLFMRNFAASSKLL